MQNIKIKEQKQIINLKKCGDKLANKKQEAKITPFQQQCIDVIKKIREYKISCEANVCAILYKNPDLIRESDLKLEEFSENIWRVYFQILYDIILVEGKNVIDDIIVGTYLEQHGQLKKMYEQYGGWETINKATTYIKEKAFDGYLSELRKWEAMIKLAKKGWVNKSRMSEYVDMTAEEIYNEYQVYINDIFVNIDHEVKSYDISSGLDELIDKLDEGFIVGLPYYNMPMLTQEVNGQYLGSITLLGGLSNSGKSSLSRTSIIPSIVAHHEQIVIMINEDSFEKWQRELLVFVANSILKYDLQKHVVRDGHFTEETKKILKESAEWIKENTQNHTITIIPFKNYKTSNAIKIIKKYASMGVKYFLLDTFKMDAGKVSEKSWLEMQQNMVEIHDTVKAEVLNVHIMITFQLAKGSANQRYYTQENIGMAKNIVDPASTCIMLRNLYDDEYTGESKEIRVFKLEGKSKIPVRLDKDKKYQILFIVKNREGAANNFQIVIEHDMSRNTIKEIGICYVPIDW